MNFLLQNETSPEDFTITFKEPITIEKDSKVYLDFAEFVRDGDLILDTDQFISYQFAFPLPTYHSFKTGLIYEKNINSPYRVRVPAGKYNAHTLQEYLNEQTNRMLLNSHTATPFTNPTIPDTISKRYNHNYELPTNNRYGGFGNKVFVGIKLNSVSGFGALGDTLAANEYDREDFTARLTTNQDAGNYNLLNNNTTVSAGGKIVGTGVVGSNACANTAFSEHKFFHYGTMEGVPSDLYFANNKEKRVYNEVNTIRAKSSLTIGDAVVGGAAANKMVFFGLDSIDLRKILFNDFTFDGTSGNPDMRIVNQDSTYGIPICLFGVKLFATPAAGGATNAQIQIFSSNMNVDTGYFGKNFTNGTSNAPLAMTLIEEFEIMDYHDSIDQKPKLAIRTYYDTSYYDDGSLRSPVDRLENVGRKNLYVQVWIYNRKNSYNTWEVIYDSGSEEYFESVVFGANFLNGFNDQTTDAQRNALAYYHINSAIPFNVIAGTSNTSGFEYIKFHRIGDSSTPTTQGNLPTIPHQYTLSFTEELAQFITSSTAKTFTSEALFPTLYADLVDYDFPNRIIRNLAKFTIADLRLERKGDSYSIYIENLPLKHFKNYLGSNFGYSKSILANIPFPYIFTKAIGNEIVATYEPSVKNVIDLNNQQFQTNNFKISIKKMENDKPTQKLKRVIISMTIVPPNSPMIN